MAYCRDIPMLLADSKLNENRRSNGQTLIVYDRGFITVGRGIAAPTAAPKRCVKISLHTAPQ